jgi:hypothetical protein
MQSPNSLNDAASARVIYHGLEPVDLKRCQADIKVAHNPWGVGCPPPQWQRCDRVPSIVAVEPDRIGLRGAMALCRSCAAECRRRNPTYGYAPAAPFKAAFKLGGHQAVRDMVYAHVADQPVRSTR